MNDYRNRVELPTMGVFLQSDPLGLQTEGGKLTPEQRAFYWAGQAPEAFSSSEMNLYRYCHNDPVNNSDPFGLEFFPGQFEEVTAIPNEPGLVGLTTPKLELSIQMVQAPSGGFSLQSKVDVRITSKLVATTAHGRPRDRAAIEQTKVHENKHEGVARKWHDANQNKVPKGPFKTADEAVKAAKEAGDKIKADFNRTQEIDKQHKPDSVWKSILEKDR